MFFRDISIRLWSVNLEAVLILLVLLFPLILIMFVFEIICV
jgi:hypothetical protein